MTITTKSGSAPVLAVLISLFLSPLTATADGKPFEQALADAYQALSTVEQAQGDNRDAETYAARAQAALAGHPGEPDQPELRRDFLKPGYVAELSAARERLMATFAKDARNKAAQPAARAQSSFDCWLEQAAEDLQPDHIDACKRSFLTAVADVEKALIPPPPPPPVVDPDSDGDGVVDSRDDCPGTAKGTPVDERGCPQIPSLKGVHFEHDSATLTAAARTVLDGVATTLKSNPHVRLEIVGHTDASGSDDYNLGLSQQRAASVKAYLGERGVASAAMSTDGRGEAEPVADNATREGRAANRRVELTARPR